MGVTRHAVPLLGVLGLAAQATTSATAYASEPSQRARLVYAVDSSAVAQCPDEAALRKAVGTRLGYDPFWPWAPRTLIVQVWRDHGSFFARVVKVEGAGAAVTREIPSDADCQQVVSAAALAASIALDITPSTPPPPATQTAPPPPPESTPPPEVHSGPPDATPPPPERAADAEPHRWFAVGAGIAGFSSGIVPVPGASFFAFAELRGRNVSLAAELQLGATPSEQEPTLGTPFQAWLGSVVLSPCVRLPPVFGCGLAEVGWLQASSSAIPGPGTEGGSFVILGGRAGVELPFSTRMFVRIHGDVLAEAYGPRFAARAVDVSPMSMIVSQGTTLAASVGGALGLGLGAYLP